MDNFELQFELEKVRTLVSCLDDALEKAMFGNSSPEGDTAVCLMDLLQERLDKLMAIVDHSERGAA